MSTMTAPRRSRPLPRAIRRALSHDFFESLTAPHGPDRWLEMINPVWTVDGQRCVVTDIERETDDVVTVTLGVGRTYRHEAGQYLRFGVEVDGHRRKRSYSISSSARRRDGQVTITVKHLPGGMVSTHIHEELKPGDVVWISEPDGELTVSENPIAPVLLVSGGSGITPVMSILRTLVDDGHTGPVTFLHYTRFIDQTPFLGELREIEQRNENIQVLVVPTDEPNPDPDGLSGFMTDEHLAAVQVDVETAITRACGPLGLTETVAERWEAAGRENNLRVEAFEAKTIEADPDAATGTLTLTDSQIEIANDGRTILDQAEAAGLIPESGCRQGICGSCHVTKTSGPVKDVRTDEISGIDEESIPICVSVPCADTEIDL